jgi:murein DD-endopeptidase MepM/ murein hydrolase activator NlpD
MTGQATFPHVHFEVRRNGYNYNPLDFLPHGSSQAPWQAITRYDTGHCPSHYPGNGHGWSGALIWPTTSHGLKEGRGYKEWHPAIDILSPLGALIYAAETGVVVWAGYSLSGAGNLVVLDHGEGWLTYYAHMDQVYVSCGQTVEQGTGIGTVGQTGQAAFPHLHFEVRQEGGSYNPLNYLPSS